VSEQLLLHHFALVDLLEPSRHLLDTAVSNLSRAISNGTYPPGRRLGQQLCCGLQQFTPEAGRWGAQRGCGEGGADGPVGSYVLSCSFLVTCMFSCQAGTACWGGAGILPMSLHACHLVA
jgi:hypothetical protein